MAKPAVQTPPPVAATDPSLEDLAEPLSERLRTAWRYTRELLKRPFYALYERQLASKLDQWTLPQHIGIIMDGNRRFARQSGFSNASQGHARGADKLQEVLTWCYEAGIPVVSVWSFSLDNFHRAPSEVAELLRLFEDKTRELATHSDVHSNRVRVRYIGKLELLPESLRAAIRAVEEATSEYDQFQLNIAMAYGGRQEIVEAMRRYLQDQDRAGTSIDDILTTFDHRSIEPYLYTSGQPAPDLIVRTSGEVRMSGFMLWQSAHSEFYFCDTFWPAFRRIDLLRALRAFDQRQRRFGR